METEPKISFEIFPPAGAASEDALWRTVSRLEPLNPAFVSVTYGAGGSTRERSTAILDRLVADTNLRKTAATQNGPQNLSTKHHMDGFSAFEKTLLMTDLAALI